MVMEKDLSGHVLTHDISSSSMLMLLMEILCHSSWRPCAHGYVMYYIFIATTTMICCHLLMIFHVFGMY